MGSTAVKGIPYFDGTSLVDNLNEEDQAKAERLEQLIDGAFTTVQRDALAGADRWTGRTIWNMTTTQREVWDGAAWRPVSTNELADWTETIVDHGNAGVAEDIDLNVGNVHKLILDANVTLAITNPPAAAQAQRVVVVATQDAVGGRTITWPASVRWPDDGAVPNASTQPNVTNVYELRTYDGGATWHGRKLFGQVTSQTFSYTGGEQTFTVPTGVTEVLCDVQGAEGGEAATDANAGLGGRVRATVPVTPGEVLRIYVGQKPTGALGGYNGGGASPSSHGGGGASDIRQGGVGLQHRVVVAAGGGGAPQYRGGGPGGFAGGEGSSYTGGAGGGGGGTQIAGGAGGPAGSVPGAAGSLGQGGAGGDSGYDGAGGGGGYYGGGGGGGDAGQIGAGGGGGSNYAAPYCEDVRHTTGFRAGNGEVVISW